MENMKVVEIMKIVKAKKQDVLSIAKIGQLCFSGLKELKNAKKWIAGNFACYPRMQYFVAKESDPVRGNVSNRAGRIVGYILWVEKGGFRKESVWEMEQIAVHPDCQGKGAGAKLINMSLVQLKKYLQKRGSKLKLIEVTTGASNRAQRLYQKTLNAKVEATIKDFFREDEAIMIAREKREE